LFQKICVVLGKKVKSVEEQNLDNSSLEENTCKGHASSKKDSGEATKVNTYFLKMYLCHV